MRFLIISLFSFLIIANSVDSINLIINGSVKRGLILFLRKENWKVNLNNREIELNSEWTKKSKKNKFIAHRLGDYENPNTIIAAEKSFQRGIQFMEIDLIFNETNELCILLLNGKKKCNLKKVLEFITKNQIHLILDFKNKDFKKSSISFLNTIEKTRNPKSTMSQIIFQLYQPKDIDTFFKINNKYKDKYKFNLPIITLYRSYSPLKRFLKNKPKLLNAFTIPIERKKEVKEIKNKKDLIILTHPIKNCNDLEIATNYNFTMVYGPSKLVFCEFNSLNQIEL